jgi:mono/diheme cytochrome c family protein
MKHTTMLAFVAALALLAASSCRSARRGPPFTGEFRSSERAVERGHELFAEHCDRCHPGGEAGLGPALNDKPLPRFLVKFQVRHGLGAMPAFSHDALSSQELDELTRFVVAYRRDE